MPKIYELLGYPIRDQSPGVQESRRKAYCPFRADICDGGGNRCMAEIDLAEHRELGEKFPGLTHIPSGVCSIQVTEHGPPWIICPRRLLYMGRKATADICRGEVQRKLYEACGYPQGTVLGIWAEVKVKYASVAPGEDAAAFDYTFDYVLMPLGRVSKREAMCATGLEWPALQKRLRDGGHDFAQAEGATYIADFPVGSPTIVEVMTSSTSGGNRKKRSCIPQAFEDCMLGKPHSAPGINYRQVWARMASQLIVKSQAAIQWNGKAIWVLQDLLADYISSSTALQLRRFSSEHTDEVNLLSFSYGDHYLAPEAAQTVSLGNATLFSGPIRARPGGGPPCFQDIVLAAVCPPREVFVASLCKKPLENRITV